MRIAIENCQGRQFPSFAHDAPAWPIGRLTNTPDPPSWKEEELEVVLAVLHSGLLMSEFVPTLADPTLADRTLASPEIENPEAENPEIENPAIGKSAALDSLERQGIHRRSRGQLHPVNLLGIHLAVDRETEEGVPNLIRGGQGIASIVPGPREGMECWVKV